MKCSPMCPLETSVWGRGETCGKKSGDCRLLRMIEIGASWERDGETARERERKGGGGVKQGWGGGTDVCDLLALGALNVLAGRHLHEGCLR